ncbi:protein SUPPRESSOR OF GENE SILENCING 3 isoform X1 [Pistacia vera]|uniref:protein SUPPRESSOR OF GENE SILENCING 3 isoform X1 n=1 Tax=Pistacia vera TaxID=55513 RepID=UPI001262FFAE|nr:protein SUPPRESSOR OF GENE SILENCING 3 isoform X1 [Pistacia vera]XP_031285428.1 protein SUPPRESSOR OF GENE SILENCING 3 isoform X1 [Pistacia vera]XP_031285429.1 protein SUPPRESSOR OF GENE SILENCING 3 isoform X1 [Pistacia vera]XP_031285430.1 protein SUPPRESSOR OF GENE SILENCING 3 isoform X1 [Pistacia vera]
MSSRRGGEKPVGAGAAEDEGEWQVASRKSKNRANNSAPKPNIGGSGRAPGKTWAHTSEPRTQPSRGSVRPHAPRRMPERNYMPPQPVIPPPLERGWNWQSRAGSLPSKGFEDGQKDKSVHNDYEDNAEENYDDDKDDDSDIVDDSEDELFSDEFDSDTSQKSYETRKKSRWFRKFFESLDNLTIEELNEPERQWHCPACQRGPGAIDWYRGLQPLMVHAKTKGSKRVKPHRELAKLLDEELYRRGTSVVPSSEAFGRWKGLKDEEKDHEIVWPPMVVIMNTRLEKDENDKWIGMGNQELIDYFNSYAAVRARHSYGPQGHRGMSVLIFESSAGGYLEAERLHKHFSDQGTDRDSWNRRQVLFHPGGKRQLYGFMATKEDLDVFNQHSQGKSKLKYELRSYQEMVVRQIRQMSEDNQQLNYFKNKVDKVQRHSKTLEESFGIVSERLRKTIEENRIVKQRTRLQHEQNKEEMDFQEQFFKEQIRIIQEARDAKEEDFEMLQQGEREKAKQSIENTSSTEDIRQRTERMAEFIKLQDKEMEVFEKKREAVFKIRDEKLAASKRKFYEEQCEIENECSAMLSRLMEEYAHIQDS